jgi:hypothetical protein
VRLSRDKVNKLAHVVTDAVADMDSVDFIEDRKEARRKIESQRKTIIEGSEEWTILYRKYYNDEVKKLGV